MCYFATEGVIDSRLLSSNIPVYRTCKRLTEMLIVFQIADLFLEL